MIEKYKPKNGYVQDLRKELEEMTSTEREIFLIHALDSTFGILKPNCWKVKKMKSQISVIREEILDD